MTKYKFHGYILSTKEGIPIAIYPDTLPIDPVLFAGWLSAHLLIGKTLSKTLTPLQSENFELTTLGPFLAISVLDEKSGLIFTVFFDRSAIGDIHFINAYSKVPTAALEVIKKENIVDPTSSRLIKEKSDILIKFLNIALKESEKMYLQKG